MTFTITPENKTYSLDLSSPSSSVSEGDSFDGKADLAVTCSEGNHDENDQEGNSTTTGLYEGNAKDKRKDGIGYEVDKCAGCY